MTVADQPRLQAGGTLNPRRHIYIRRPQDDELLAFLLSGEYVNVLTSRQMGNSSLMMRTAFELQARGVKFVSIDLAAALGGSRDAESYYLGLIGQIARSLKLPLELDDFDPQVEDLTPIVRALSADPEAGARLLDRVLNWTGGHPYLTVKLCVDLMSAGVRSEADVDRHVEATYGRLERISADVHFQQILRFVANRLGDSLATFDLYERILDGKRERDRTTLTHAELKLSDLVKRDAEGCLVVRNRIYERLFDLRWIAGSKPRPAVARYRRWALAASFLLVTVIVGMGAFFWWASVREYPPGIAAQGLLVRFGLLSAIEPEMRTLSAGSFQMGVTKRRVG